MCACPFYVVHLMAIVTHLCHLVIRWAYLPQSEGKHKRILIFPSFLFRSMGSSKSEHKRENEKSAKCKYFCQPWNVPQVLLEDDVADG